VYGIQQKLFERISHHFDEKFGLRVYSKIFWLKRFFVRDDKQKSLVWMDKIE
jgi:hypothetical protein